MNLGQISFGQRLAAIGAVVLLLSMTVFDWYGLIGDNNFGGNAFNHPGFTGGIADVLLIAACAVAIGGAVLAATSRSLALPVALNALTCGAGAVAMFLVFMRMIFQPGPNKLIELNIWIAVGFFAAACIAYGGWIAMRDDAAREGIRRAAAEPAPTSQPQA